MIEAGLGIFSIAIPALWLALLLLAEPSGRAASWCLAAIPDGGRMRCFS